MRLFQLTDDCGVVTGLFNVTIPEEKFADDAVEQVLKDYQELLDDEDDDNAENLLDISCIERVFYREVYC